MGKKELSTRSQDSTSGFLAPAIFYEKCPEDEARSDCGRGVVHVYEKYFILAIRIIFLNLKLNWS